MKIQLLKGSFYKNDALNLITRLISVKIKYHEEKIEASDNEEDIKMREKRIIELQKELFEVKKQLEKATGPVVLNSEISI